MFVNMYPISSCIYSGIREHMSICSNVQMIKLTDDQIYSSL